jgi:hypothetical protein
VVPENETRRSAGIFRVLLTIQAQMTPTSHSMPLQMEMSV